ncbi:hypothetical protein [Marilutibacter maris]|nr:hypothetical protein [Lysobacter maris]
MYRLGHSVEGQWVAHSHPPVFRMPAADARSQGIVAGVPGSDPEVFLRLSRCLEEPLFLLYVLHTCRGEAETGRYQSPELSFRDLEAFVDEFRPLLCADGRFDLWAYSPEQKATVVWDRHNLLYAYGPLDRYATELRSLGFGQGIPEVPAPHTHHYRSELDALAGKLIDRFDWVYSPLRPEDEQ